MTASEALEILAAASTMEAEVREQFPCSECDGEGELWPGIVWHPCHECRGTGIQQDLDDLAEEEEDEEEVANAQS